MTTVRTDPEINDEKNKTPLEIIHAIQEHIREWKERHKKEQEIMPSVDKIEKLADWKEQALRNIPIEIDEIPTNLLLVDLKKEYKELQINLPLQPKYDVGLMISTESGSTAGTISAFRMVEQIGDYESIKAKEYSKKYIGDYMALQNAQNRINDVRNLIKQSQHDNLLKRFENAVNSISSYHLSVEDRQSASNHIRNLLMGEKGFLFEKARRWPKENMTWEEMAIRLAKSEDDNDKINKQKVIYSSLINRTSEILKDRNLGAITNIDYIWTETIDHLYIIFSILTL